MYSKCKRSKCKCERSGFNSERSHLNSGYSRLKVKGMKGDEEPFRGASFTRYCLSTERLRRVVNKMNHAIDYFVAPRCKVKHEWSLSAFAYATRKLYNRN